MKDICLQLIREHCGVHVESIEGLNAWLDAEIARRKYGSDLRRARYCIEEFDAGVKNEYVFEEIFERIYCATHNSVAWHHDLDVARQLLCARPH